MSGRILNALLPAGAAPMRRVLQMAAAVARILRGVLDELADQSAYRRYLARHGQAPSGEQWRRFSEARFRAKYQRAKCC